jgi:hypothetical protein
MEAPAEVPEGGRRRASGRRAAAATTASATAEAHVPRRRAPLADDAADATTVPSRSRRGQRASTSPTATLEESLAADLAGAAGDIPGPDTELVAPAAEVLHRADLLGSAGVPGFADLPGSAGSLLYPAGAPIQAARTVDSGIFDSTTADSNSVESLTTDIVDRELGADARRSAPYEETGRLYVETATEERPELGAESRNEGSPGRTEQRPGGAGAGGYTETWPEPRVDPREARPEYRHSSDPRQDTRPGSDPRQDTRPGSDPRQDTRPGFDPRQDTRPGPDSRPEMRPGPNMRPGSRQPGLDETTPWRPNGPMDPAMRRPPEPRVVHVYRSRRPAVAILLIILALGFGVLFLRSLAVSFFGPHFSAAGVISSAFAMASLPPLAIGLYGLVTGAAHGAEQYGFRLWARPPLAYLVIGLVLAVAAGAAAV